ncbi:hypothetical protein D3C72_2092380 [compost metagenome]
MLAGQEPAFQYHLEPRGAPLNVTDRLLDFPQHKRPVFFKVATQVKTHDALDWLASLKLCRIDTQRHPAAQGKGKPLPAHENDHQ